jgi:probable DNA metabolism protein
LDITYVYDGTFEGFLTAVYDSYYDKNKPEKIVSVHDYEPDLINNTITIDTDIIKSNKVYSAIENKISKDALINVFNVFLSSIKNTDTLLYEYIKLGFKLGKDVDMHLHNDTVLSIHNISRKVGLEKHRMIGFVRFTKLSSDIFYSAINPDHNILSLIAPHFIERFQDQNWIIHDVKRETAVIYNGKDCVLTVMPRNYINLERMKEDSEQYESLWKEYFTNIAIKERINPKLQKLMMPVRYWDNLIECIKK